MMCCSKIFMFSMGVAAVTKMSCRQAIQNALDIEMARDGKVFIIGEDVSRNGCSFGQFNGLPDKFGDRRVVNTPLSEAVITGIGLGAAAYGLRPVVNHDFIDFLGCCFDEILNQIAKLRIAVRQAWQRNVKFDVGFGGFCGQIM